jgi:glycosyltransferase involved in cell wall biosynthesis
MQACANAERSLTLEVEDDADLRGEASPPAPANRPGRAESIIRAHDALLAAYLLGPGAQAGWAGFSEESCARFLLRFAFEWRHGRQQAVFSPDYLAFLADPAPPFSSRLSAYVFLCDGAARRRFGRDIGAYEDWLHGDGAALHRLGPLVCADRRHRAAAAGNAPWRGISPISASASAAGVNLIGFADGVLGLGEDLRMMARAALRAGLNVAIVDVGLHGRSVTSRPHGWDGLLVERPLFPVSVFCLPPFETMRLRIERGPEAFAAARNIGCWPWELTSLPPDWGMVFDLVDEVWAISPFLAEVYGRLTLKPVRHAPPHVAVEDAAAAPRSAFGLSDGQFVVLTMLDLNSFMARKNPLGSIAAFLQAFPDRSGPERLLLKTLNGAAHPEALGSLKAAADGDPRVLILDRALSKAETLGLIKASDALLSLHRSEGFGRVPAEAMLLGVPVAATGWSGVMSYLDAQTGWPIAFSLRPVRPDEYIHVAGSAWAEPDISSAAAALRDIAGRPEEAARRTAAARARIADRHGLDAVAAQLGAMVREASRVSAETMSPRQNA